MKRTFIGYVLFFAATISAQIPSNESTFHYPRATITKIGTVSWAMGGAGIANPLDATAGFNNPALQSSYRNIFYAEFGKRLETENAFEGWVQLDNQQFLPAFAALSNSTWDTNFSIGYTRYSSFREEMDVSIYTYDRPAGLRLHMQRKLDVHYFFVAGRYELSAALALGLNVGINYAKYSETISQVDHRAAKGRNYQYTLGAIYSPVESLNFAATFRRISDVEMKYPDIIFDFNPGGFLGILPDSLDFQFEILNEREITVFPDVFSLAVTHQISDHWTWAAQVDFEDWSGFTRNFEDVIQFHAGAGYAISPKFIVFAGYFTETDPTKYRGDYYDQRFFTGGINCKINKRSTLSLSIMNSRLFSNKQPGEEKDLFRQTYFSAGISLF